MKTSTTEEIIYLPYVVKVKKMGKFLFICLLFLALLPRVKAQETTPQRGEHSRHAGK
jgi:hypothetical protein